MNCLLQTKTWTLSTLLALSITALPIKADDIDVYITPASNPVAPNVLFVLDESGSMSWGNPSRMSQLKQAMINVLSDTDNDNINAAIMAYTTRWHPTKILHRFGLIRNERINMINDVKSLTPLYGTPSIHALSSAVLWFERGFRGQPSPIGTGAKGNWCRPNYIVFLSDGSPNSNWYERDLNNTLELNTDPDQYRGTRCSQDTNSGAIYNPYDGNNNGGSCARELGSWAISTDLRTGGEWDWSATDSTHNPDNKRIQNIVIHTIGMAMGDNNPPASNRERFMKFIAREGGGRYFSANNAAQLSSAFQTILTQAKTSIPYTYTAPTVPFNRDNAAVSGEYIYVPLFKPGVHELWYGNVKKYRLGFEPGDPNDPNSTKKLVLRDKKKVHRRSPGKAARIFRKKYSVSRKP